MPHVPRLLCYVQHVRWLLFRLRCLGRYRIKLRIQNYITLRPRLLILAGLLHGPSYDCGCAADQHSGDQSNCSLDEVRPVGQGLLPTRHYADDSKSSLRCSPLHREKARRSRKSPRRLRDRIEIKPVGSRA